MSRRHSATWPASAACGGPRWPGWSAASTPTTPKTPGKRPPTSNHQAPGPGARTCQSNSRAGPLPPKWKESIMSDAHRDGHAAARHAAVIAELLARVQEEVTGAAVRADVAEDEIAQAAAGHPQAADALFHSFRLLLPAFEAKAWHTEFVLRAHCRELLERVASGQDTRPGTNAECLLAVAQVAMEVPLNGAAASRHSAFRSEEHTSELQSHLNLVCRLLLEKKKN